VDKSSLSQKQSLPLKVKINLSKKRIREWHDAHNGKVYVSFSGGKDSLVLLHLVRSIFPKVQAVFFNTGLEYPEIVSFVRQHKNVFEIRPQKTFRQVIEQYGYPVISKEQSHYIYQYRNTKSEKLKKLRWQGIKSKNFTIAKKWRFLVGAPFKISAHCCDILKKAPAGKFESKTGLKPFLGILATEGNLRTQHYLKYGCNAFHKKRPTSQPLSFWTEQDILKYIQKFKLKLCSVYGQIKKESGILSTTGVKRTGCMFCLFGIHLEKSPNRFEQMKKSHPLIYSYCIKKLGIGKVLDFIGVSY